MIDESEQIVRADEIHTLLEHFSKNSYRVKGDSKGDPVTDKCLKLFAKDYQFTVINNTTGDLCSHYPSKLAILEYEKSSTVKERVESIYDNNKVKNIFKQARFARCRSRFVIPVILFEGKNVCRSATVSSGAEMYSRSGLDFIFTGGEQSSSTASRPVSSSSEQSDMQMFDRVRGQDINVLKTFSVKYIVDLMVEKKKVKFGMNVTSSEKVDKENRYGEFCIVSVPYPGCEFFKEWKDNSYLGEVMQFDWTQGYVDACLDIPPTEVLRQLSIDWSQYKCWNLIQLTQNYLKMMLHVLKEGDKGVLVHCISGWDRTPMFVSLLRLSLWADGAIHKSLTATEIVYLTLAYDWYLFGHNLSDRLNKGEEILFFCFYFLSHITSEEYSIDNKR
ncbi:myotubularin-related protein 14-like [Ruditapes philippinarum]|uniref:myotubularin-related protein 14-like n=1 Tax=Ruditapes philippinarum TaxID=129788 RepID=UPI00295A7813|nr:myotubularin-related protein 14-like [Ruditapes philippinarum]